ncbi:hypothetical protein [Acidisoma sp. L85]|uniref:hypothetical protein n=1 Tax=Acidisoma sp. L85 TaxID=1641850 RepID=UPI00131B3627|nr:hypothetical protein [Acidisoma sp. L85]
MGEVELLGAGYRAVLSGQAEEGYAAHVRWERTGFPDQPFEMPRLDDGIGLAWHERPDPEAVYAEMFCSPTLVNGEMLVRARPAMGDLFTGALDELGRYNVVADEVQTKPTDAASWTRHRAV